jgi:hypothetical protein
MILGKFRGVNEFGECPWPSDCQATWRNIGEISHVCVVVDRNTVHCYVFHDLHADRSDLNFIIHPHTCTLQNYNCYNI